MKFEQKLGIPQWHGLPNLDAIASVREPVAGVIQFDKLTPYELQLCVAIGARASAMTRDLMKQRKNVDIEVDPMACAMDVAAVHLSRPLQLLSFLQSNDLDFIGDFITIQTNIQRACGMLPVFIHLRFEVPRT